MSAVGKQYIVSVLFRNILTCLYGNTTSEFFEIEPPTLLEYLAWLVTLDLCPPLVLEAQTKKNGCRLTRQVVFRLISSKYGSMLLYIYVWSRHNDK